MRRSRRLMVPLLAGVPALAAFGAVAGGFTHPLPWWSYLVWIASAALSSVLIGTYAGAGNLSGRCGSCSRLAIGFIPVALLMQAGHADILASTLSVFMLGTGLVQRLSSAATCGVPAGTTAGPAEPMVEEGTLLADRTGRVGQLDEVVPVSGGHQRGD